jgi:crotonobetainyl-CoA:carnitine CoA-transferase CaiB-like acyl-CoA transferase
VPVGGGVAAQELEYAAQAVSSSQTARAGSWVPIQSPRARVVSQVRSAAVRQQMTRSAGRSGLGSDARPTKARRVRSASSYGSSSARK